MPQPFLNATAIFECHSYFEYIATYTDVLIKVCWWLAACEMAFSALAASSAVVPQVAHAEHDGDGDREELSPGDVGTVAVLFGDGVAGAFVGAATLLFVTIRRARKLSVGIAHAHTHAQATGEAELSPMHGAHHAGNGAKDSRRIERTGPAASRST
jgi:hypothetical protein